VLQSLLRRESHDNKYPLDSFPLKKVKSIASQEGVKKIKIPPNLPLKKGGDKRSKKSAIWRFFIF